MLKREDCGRVIPAKAGMTSTEVTTLQIGCPYAEVRNGFIATINTDVGPHAVHVLDCDRRTHSVRYYDPMGADGQSNVKEVTLEEFNRIRITDWVFAKITVVEPVS